MPRSISQTVLLSAAAAAGAGALPPLGAALAGAPAWAVAAAAAAGIPLGLAAGAGVGRAIARRAQSLLDASLELTRGKMGVAIELAGDDQLAKLAQVLSYASQQLAAFEGENRRLYGQLDASMLETMVLIANMIDSKDSLTHGHSQRVGDWATEIGREMGMTDHELRHLLYGGLVHDIGKIGIIEPILGKRSALDEEEMDAMRAHPVIGTSIIGSVSFLKPVVAAVRHHHERWDGTGYPDKLAGEAIPLVARIVAVADCWDALTSHRPYQEAMTSDVALGILAKLRAKSLDPAVVDAMTALVRRKRERGERASVADPASSAAG